MDHKNESIFKKITGGPMNLGDPNDKSLRNVEEFIFIKQLIKDRAHHEKCKEQVQSKAFNNHLSTVVLF
jgi:hypothetical protein